ncbi:MAG: hypothetical protein LC737_05570, partial [Chloroflexi bacterium]|nr:hypothetical protein [Chloroflexota bacterium]
PRVRIPSPALVGVIGICPPRTVPKRNGSFVFQPPGEGVPAKHRSCPEEVQREIRVSYDCTMDFPMVDLLDDEVSTSWLLKYFHPHGLKCPHGAASGKSARTFRQTQRSQLCVYRCEKCQGLYTLYSGTVFAGKHLRPAQVVLLLRAVCKGEPSLTLAREIKVSRTTLQAIRQALQANAKRLQPTTRLNDQWTETDELFQNAGEKGPETQRSSRPSAATR